jgi:hypothetical protein
VNAVDGDTVDLARECFCTCHIPIAKLSQSPQFGVWIRIECTQRSYFKDNSGKLCIVCGRKGKDRYGPIPDAEAKRLGLAAHHEWRNPVSDKKIAETLKGFKDTLDKHFAALDHHEEERKKAVKQLEDDLIRPMSDLLDLWLSDGHVGADFENWILIAKAFGKEQEARELAASYDPEGKWETREAAKVP